MEEKSGFISSFFTLDATGVVVGLIAAALCYKLMFRDFEDFKEQILYWVDSNRRGSYQEMFSEEWWGATKILMWLGVSAAIAFGVSSL